MNDRENDKQKTKPEAANDATKPSRQDVGPPGERVDDETDSADAKTTRRQE